MYILAGLQFIKSISSSNKIQLNYHNHILLVISGADLGVCGAISDLVVLLSLSL
jgi:hypothetical protein